MDKARSSGHIGTTGDEGGVDGFAGLRTRDFGYLDEGGHTYLDHTGAGLPPRSLVTGSAERLITGLFGNPHSESPASRASGLLLAEARRAVLRHFDADPAEYAVIFTPNATGALRLVGEAYPFARGSRLVMSLDNHNSVNGLREYARARGAATAYVPVSGTGLRIDEERLWEALSARGRGAGRHLSRLSRRGGPGLLGRPGGAGLPGRRGGPGPRGLLAYPAQSNFTGVQHPLEWIARAQEHGYDVLLDAAAFVPTNPLDLSRFHPDFTVVSWYKVFGHPTGIGSLIARREALAKLRRPWFSGGTIYAVSAQAQWHVLADDEAAFEDGTVNFLSVPDVTAGLEWIDRLGMDRVHAHVAALTGRLLAGLGTLRHSDGSPMVRVYGPLDAGAARGGTVALNLLGADGRIVDERVVTRDSAARGISLRTGCFCNPGAGEAAFALPLRRLRSAAGRQLGSTEEYLSLLQLPSAGAVRISLGVSSQPRDIETFLTFVTQTYRDRVPGVAGLAARVGC
ncbi:aminotransferase class V-fold PLP-dependent enzyme [Streptomyces sp. NBC_01549]|uniref:aminotransferase class V-fold PLP-dependent enzyme n=1 Tax=Streptomyces sp. NBC_01549 TaxID=2975874 RepID=UPI0022540B68|nr:aminotransferase class V-fold PLP-dependent enzyme [Streptomyces sp. NBC_01549]MCX4594360.1 aminotransferase class V-fold PLP-dependent enzyme [Streptomyces sp. NBC_01549]